MPMMRVPRAATTTTAQGTTGGELTLTATTGMARNAVLAIDKPTAPSAGGWEVVVERVVDLTHVTARWADTGSRPAASLRDLSAIPSGANVLMAEQWVPDLWSDDAPAGIAVPVKAV